jgi:dTDP-4-dehydrorhamnose reductase
MTAAQPERDRIVVTGPTGQLGSELVRTLARLGDVIPLDRAALDLTKGPAIRAKIRSLAPTVIVNAAGYTTVDRAESEPVLAHSLNAEAPAILAEEARRANAILMHYSTDFVFDGKNGNPYTEADPTNPINVYGATKLRGERAVLDSGADVVVLRVAWVFSRGGKNFLSRVRDLALEKGTLKVVSDELGTPTWARSIAEATAAMLYRILDPRKSGPRPPLGLFHLVSPDHASRHDFAVAAVAGDPASSRPTIIPVPGSAYPASAPRPARSVLDAGKIEREYGIRLPSWREQLRQCLEGSGGA